MKPTQYPLLILLQLATIFAFPQAWKSEVRAYRDGCGIVSRQCDLHPARQPGFMWFGTREGLNKYDGYGFVVYKNSAEDSLSLSDNHVTGIVEDQKGDIWISTAGGLNRFDWSKKPVYTLQRLHSSDLISALMLDDSGKIWLDHLTGGVFVLEPTTGKVVLFSNDSRNTGSLSDNNVSAILEDSHHQIWIGTLRGGLNLFDRDHHSFTRYQHWNKDTSSLVEIPS